MKFGKQRLVVLGWSSRGGAFEIEEEDFQGGETNVGTGVDEVARRTGTVEVESQLVEGGERKEGKR